MPLFQVYTEANARQLSYLIERLNSCPMNFHAGASASIEETVERAYWDQVMTGLRRGLDKNDRLARVLH